MMTPSDTSAPARMHAGRTAFNGELFEFVTGHYLLGMGYRPYSPVLLRFLQPDSWSPFGTGGLNAYAYCEGDPVNAADPTGHMPFRRLFQVGRWTRLPSPDPHRQTSNLPVLSGNEVAEILEGLTPGPVPGSSAGRFSSAHILADTAPAVSQSSSVLPTSAGSAGPSGGVQRSHRRNVDYQHIETEVSRMIPSNNAGGIIALANEPFSKIPVLRELHRQLPLTPSERRTAQTTSRKGPTISQGDFLSMEARARREGPIEKVEFYAQLRRALFVVTSRRTTLRRNQRLNR